MFDLRGGPDSSSSPTTQGPPPFDPRAGENFHPRDNSPVDNCRTLRADGCIMLIGRPRSGGGSPGLHVLSAWGQQHSSSIHCHSDLKTQQLALLPIQSLGSLTVRQLMPTGLHHNANVSFARVIIDDQLDVG